MILREILVKMMSCPCLLYRRETLLRRTCLAFWTLVADAIGCCLACFAVLLIVAAILAWVENAYFLTTFRRVRGVFFSSRFFSLDGLTSCFVNLLFKIL